MQLFSWTDLTSPISQGEIAPYSWTSALSVRNLVVYRQSGAEVETYTYNATDQLTSQDDCTVFPDNAGNPPCIAYDYRGNTTSLRGMAFRYDTSNRLVYEKATPQSQVPANPLSFSPTQQRIVFASSRDGNSEIYTVAADGGDLRRLTDHPASDSFPAYSPEGSRIVFVSDRDGNSELYSMASDGSDIRRLTDDPAEDTHPTYGPDGSYIVFASRRDGQAALDLYRLDLVPDGRPGPVRRLTQTEGAEAFPRVSSSGDKTAFSYLTGWPLPPFAFTSQIGVVAADGSSLELLTPEDQFNYLPAWSPDARTLAITSGRDGDLEIYIMAEDGTNQRRLTQNPASDAAPAFLNQDLLVFASDRDHPDSSTAELYTIRIDGTQESRLTQDADISSPPQPGPLGTSPPPPNTPQEVFTTYDALSRPLRRTTRVGEAQDSVVFGYTGPSSVPTYLKDPTGKITWRTFMAAGLQAYADTSGPTPHIRFLSPDRRGDTTEETGPGGGLTARRTFEEYGNLRQGPTPSPYGFLGSYGRMSDPTTSLYLLGARLYDPTLGRFLSRDPISQGSSNDYEYGWGNPISSADPSGRSHCQIGSPEALALCAANPGSDVVIVPWDWAHGPFWAYAESYGGGYEECGRWIADPSCNRGGGRGLFRLRNLSKLRSRTHKHRMLGSMVGRSVIVTRRGHVAARPPRDRDVARGVGFVGGGIEGEVVGSPDRAPDVSLEVSLVALSADLWPHDLEAERTDD